MLRIVKYVRSHLKQGTAEQYTSAEQSTVILDLKTTAETLQRELEVARNEITAYQQQADKNSQTLQSVQKLVYAVGERIDKALEVASRLAKIGQEQSNFITEIQNSNGKYLTTEAPILEDMKKHLQSKLGERVGG